MNKYIPAVTYKVIYVYTIHDEDHEGKLKVGKADLASLKSATQLTPNCDELIKAARKRIDEQTKTAMVKYDLIYTELGYRFATLEDGSPFQVPFDDHEVHEVLKNSGYRPEVFRESGKDSEWFKIDIETVKRAIKAVKSFDTIIAKSVDTKSIKNVLNPIVLRDEQKECIEKTISTFANDTTMLWDCKMRFGKTVTAYELIKKLGYKKVIVITHRPAVSDGWDTDHNLIFKGTNHSFIDKSQGTFEGYDEVIDSKNDQKLWDCVQHEIPFVYFASIQDLRGSKRVGGNYNKNNAVFDIEWDMIIIDEAHEGTQTELGEAVIKNIRKETTKVLSLTGTAYNLRKEYGDNVFTWTYVDEQRAKRMWAEHHPDEKNPYEDLPTMNILTFDISDKIENSYRYVTEDSAFNFREFFRTWSGDIKRDFYPVPEGKHIGDFVYEEAVWSFLNLISRKDESTNYPFSTDEYVDMFRHTFWLVPGVKEAKALSRLMKAHPFFSSYEIVNVAGEGDEEEKYEVALQKVKKAIDKSEKTITISCGRLTTGITVREWTAVMMLSGSSSTAVNGYMQTIFRVQSPGIINGKRKDNCYVFDFAPDRALRVIGEVHRLSAKSGSGDEPQRVAMGEFLNFCPVIAVDGTEMKEYDVPEMMRQIKRISVDNAINSGFDDDTIYLTDAGIVRNDLDVEILRKLSDVVAPKKKGQKNKSVILTETGMTEEEHRKSEIAQKKKSRGQKLTEEEKAALEKLRQAKKEQQKLFDLLRAVSIRLPLLFYGADADISTIIHLKDFVDIVDDESWQEFMPKNLKKSLFLQISKYYDEDVLVGAGLRIRKLAKAADEYPPTIRAAKIVEIISKFKNPDKETVLTPWRVVNMHLGSTIGGYNFFDEDYVRELDEPRLIEQEDITADILLNPNVKVLEMNSKSGLYPLYVVYSLYKIKISGKEKDHSLEELRDIWNDIVKNNVFILCKTKMAKSITRRTLVGYTGANVNAVYLTKLLSRMQDEKKFKNKLTNPQTWGVECEEGERMRFEAIVGNPPYQENKEGTSDSPIYHMFMDAAFSLADKVTFITPARFLFNAGKTPKEWNDKVLADSHIKVVYYTANSTDVFPNVDIKGGITITYRDAKTSFGPIGIYSPFDELKTILGKVLSHDNFKSIQDEIYLQNKFELDKLYADYPEIKESIGSLGKERRLTTSIFELSEIFHDEKSEDDIEVLGLINNVRVTKFINSKYIMEHENLYKWKVIVPKSNGSGAIGEVLSTPVIGQPVIGHTQSFISIGAYESEFEAKATLKYVESKFARCMLGTLKVTQDNNPPTWANVPTQDFSETSDIDWCKSVAEIDKQLYKKYGLDENEIAFIEEKVKPMD